MRKPIFSEVRKDDKVLQLKNGKGQISSLFPVDAA
jgi:hypothetical protein